MFKTVLNAGGAAEPLSTRSRALRRGGYQVTEAASEAETVRLSMELRPSVLVMSWMPGLNPETCASLKADPVTAGIPLVAICSARAQKHWARQADLWLPETASSSLIVSVVRFLLRAGTEGEHGEAVNGGAPRGPSRAVREPDRMAVHDLRSSMCTVIVISSWILGEYGDRLDAGGRECLALLQSSVERMRTAVDRAYPQRRPG